jgi:hypothetical protein
MTDAYFVRTMSQRCKFILTKPKLIKRGSPFATRSSDLLLYHPIQFSEVLSFLSASCLTSTSLLAPRSWWSCLWCSKGFFKTAVTFSSFVCGWSTPASSRKSSKTIKNQPRFLSLRSKTAIMHAYAIGIREPVYKHSLSELLSPASLVLSLAWASWWKICSLSTLSIVGWPSVFGSRKAVVRSILVRSQYVPELTVDCRRSRKFDFRRAQPSIDRWTSSSWRIED